MKFCDQCGAKLRDAAKFCDECGNKLDYKVEVAGVQASGNDSFLNNTNTIELNVEDNTFIATAKYGQGLKYESFWNDVPCKKFGNIAQKQVREYKGKLYFMADENCLTGERDNNGGNIVIGEVDKNNLSVIKRIPKSSTYTDRKSGCRVWEMLMPDCFSVFNDKIYYSKLQDVSDEEYDSDEECDNETRWVLVFSYDLITGEEKLIRQFTANDLEVSVYHILQNSKKEIICIMSVEDSAGYYSCAYNLNTVDHTKINRTSGLGYNEKYFYYKDEVDNKTVLKVMDLNTLKVENLSEKLTNISRLESDEYDAKFYMIDAARDQIIFSVEERYADNPNVVMYAVDLNDNAWKEASFETKRGFEGLGEGLVYNGEYWIYTIHPEKVEVGEYCGVECYDKTDNRIGGYYKRKEDSFFSRQGIEFALPHVFCSMWGGKYASTKQEGWTWDLQKNKWLFNFNLFYLEGDDDVDSNVVIRTGETSFYYPGM